MADDLATRPRAQRDAKYFEFFGAFQGAVAELSKSPSLTVGAQFSQVARAHSACEALRFEDRIYSYGDLDAWANQYANWARSCGLKAGDTVALATGNRPEFVAIFIGLSKIGVGMSLINIHLESDALKRSLTLVPCKLVIASHQYLGAIKATGLFTDEALFCLDEVEQAQPVNENLHETSSPPPNSEIGLETELAYIFTSGTTGFPKCAQLSNARLLRGGKGVAILLGLTETDRYYVTLPLFHTAGLMSGLMPALLSGACLVLRDKFSASNFWTDCQTHEVSCFLYIGEICKFLLNAHSSGVRPDHQVRVGFGNGLSAAVFEAFQTRFQVPRLIEYYGATESNVTLFNLDNIPGCVGYLPEAVEQSMGVKLLQVDPETGELKRGKDGFCEAAGPGVPGELAGHIAPGDKHAFYTDADETNKKIVTGAFEPDDAYFRTGDLLRKDESGSYFFVDRLGDTFRWRGENVATVEVETALLKHDQVKEACVYGVEVPGEAGRAGMAALVIDGAFDPAGFQTFVASELPKYARPLFLKLLPRVEKTSTFKNTKTKLKSDGFRAHLPDEPVYWFNGETYTALTDATKAKIEKQEIRF